MSFTLDDKDGMITIDTGNGVKIPVNILIGDNILEDWESMNNLLSGVDVSRYSDEEFMISSMSRGKSGGNAVVPIYMAEELVDKIAKLFEWKLSVDNLLDIIDGNLKIVNNVYSDSKVCIHSEYHNLYFLIGEPYLRKNGDMYEISVTAYVEAGEHTYTFTNISIDNEEESGTIDPTEQTE